MPSPCPPLHHQHRLTDRQFAALRAHTLEQIAPGMGDFLAKPEIEQLKELATYTQEEAGSFVNALAKRALLTGGQHASDRVLAAALARWKPGEHEEGHKDNDEDRELVDPVKLALIRAETDSHSETARAARRARRAEMARDAADVAEELAQQEKDDPCLPI